MPRDDKSEQNRDGGKKGQEANKEADEKGGGDSKGRGTDDQNKWFPGHPTE